ncbi:MULTISPECIES: LamG domain-containing protein [unclassified Streptomyces]|uniref:LamG domain-containing protein n=1 Tax=unclassified Streptomyces TaxID=2593676 RepID=UPI002E2EFEE1|nr:MULTISPECIES: LamG domain-containing protein [unclassified Streptomyces]WUC65948.1 LamG domain-containing protein [Streptomyces sp. NBC_00539]
MTDGTNPPSSPQPEQPAPGSGGYGFPPGTPASGGYGFPPGAPAGQQAPGGFGPPPQTGGYGYPQQPQPGPYQQGPYPQAQQPAQAQPAQQPFPLPAQTPQPDWDALADRSAAARRKKRLWLIVGGVSVLALLAAGGTFLLLGDGKGDEGKGGDDTPSASATPSQNQPPTDLTPTVPGDPTTIRDLSGKSNLKMGPDAGVFPIDKRYEVRLKNNANSFAESQQRVVDTSKSFTVVARVWNRVPKGRQIAISQGNEKSFSFELGLDEVNGKPVWIFRVQTGDQGAETTTTTVSGVSSKMERTFSELTATYDAPSKKITLYVNGKKAQEAPVPSGIFPAPGPLEIGRSRHQDNWTAPWNGAMDSLRIYDVALPQYRIDALKAGKLDPVARPTAAWLLY